ncbi:DegT/DnrJ/EryC1/StrS aminotransferase family protein [Phenylobacterium sp.]|uniref:DegT/DnrJ/EryC1/StrS family aminotransferase n=1 Tax=Phenylobacterium sp. TaxID=1871053 RepID=UPI0027304EBB|nr:DegT/DnrJ/EryC1/StrS aminotransferase family protein [Phenylobacterium sp.]MDP1600805.1 DegT/DnrJ/EryC1/StrS aminotransferase family protein [Phenylobacterium sp.]MDP3592814.1 DegT/DnrJ/EryC1/StrS aminotransferase family protein [Phenylobacterium sp.]
MPIPFIDLQAQRARLGQPLEDAILKVVRSGAYVMGPEIGQFEKALGEFGQAPFVLSCGSGTEALQLPLMAWGIGPGDAVFCPSFTFAATAEVMPLVGASPVFVDVLPDTYNLDPAKLDAAIAAVKADGKLAPKAIIAVDLFGQPADYPSISAVAKKHGLKLIADSAQGFGCTLNGQHPIHWADVTTTSFFPAKPLGCYGDGGAVLCKDERLHDILVSLRVHGQAVKSDLVGKTFDHDPKYLNLRIGMNSRMDTIQAAVLLQKLTIFESEIEARNKVAGRYAAGLSDVVTVPKVIEGGVSVWAQYTIETADRDGLAAHLKSQDIPSAVYYPIPIHKQDVYSVYPTPGGLPVTEAKANVVMSLPMHPYLTPDHQDQVIAAIRAYVKRNG